MADPKTTSEELKPKHSPEAEGELSTEELNKVSGGVKRVSSDPCEGGEFHAN